MSSQWFMRQGRPSVEPGASTLASSCAISLDRLHVHHRCSLLRFCSVSFSRACFYVRKNRASCCAFRGSGSCWRASWQHLNHLFLTAPKCVFVHLPWPQNNLGMARLQSPNPKLPTSSEFRACEMRDESGALTDIDMAKFFEAMRFQVSLKATMRWSGLIDVSPVS